MAIGKEKYANAMILITIGISVFAGLFVIAWLLMGLSGWLVWAVVALWAFAVALSIGWIVPVLREEVKDDISN